MREKISLFTNWIWEKPLLAGTPFILDHLRGPEKSSVSVVHYYSSLPMINMYGTSLLQTPPPVYVKINIIELAHARAKCTPSSERRKRRTPRKVIWRTIRMRKQ